RPPLRSVPRLCICIPMKALPSRASLAAAASAWLILAAPPARAQQAPQLPIGGLQVTPPPPPQSVVHGTLNGGFGFPGFWPYYVEHDVVRVIEREVVHDAPPAPPPPPPRKPYVLGKSYAALPGGCMKLLQDGAAYYYCSGEWYREVGA